MKRMIIALLLACSFAAVKCYPATVLDTVSIEIFLATTSIPYHTSTTGFNAICTLSCPQFTTPNKRVIDTIKGLEISNPSFFNRAYLTYPNVADNSVIKINMSVVHDNRYLPTNWFIHIDGGFDDHDTLTYLSNTESNLSTTFVCDTMPTTSVRPSIAHAATLKSCVSPATYDALGRVVQAQHFYVRKVLAGKTAVVK